MTCRDQHLSHDEWTFDPDQPGFAPRKLRVVCIGAGFSGLSLTHLLKHQTPMDFVDFTVYDKNHDIGGTWLENVYPGVGWALGAKKGSWEDSDVPAPSYVFPFEPNPDWSKFYVGGAEIQEYVLRTAEKYGLREKIVLNTKIIKSVWDETRGKWKLQLQQGDRMIEDEADILVNGTGVLSGGKWPDIAGLDSFKGKLVHSSRWDPEYDCEGQRIAVLGNGSSALQIVPALQPKAAKLVNYIRHPTWVSVNFTPELTRDGQGTNFEYTEEEKQRFRDDPKSFIEYLKKVEHAINGVFQAMQSGSEQNKTLHSIVDSVMRARLANRPDLIEKLIPDYEIGCRRLSPGDGYLEALQMENVRPCFSNITRITPTGIATDDGEEEFDVIVCATGFNVGYTPPWEMVGRAGRRLDVEWAETPEAYFATCAAGMPNYFIFTGPNAPVGQASVPRILYWMAEYIGQWIGKIAEEGIKSAVVKDQTVRDFNIYAQQGLKRSVWSKGCQAWYKRKTADGSDNVVTVLYPGSCLHYKAFLEKIRGEHFDIEYQTSNMFGFLGNGQLALESAKDADLAFYM
ncbi:hypothetical protein FE257_002460 [Aspergillus nanangensis]|uniref:Flavin-binding monooxygenase n=1 Tax=Aspergillus nanangensis TaxID=2582783 RepID=A0AAD4CST7_ASPNN|nr:hypothetical protein FE257_002460 [Aspergillus nanangensis]